MTHRAYRVNKCRSMKSYSLFFLSLPIFRGCLKWCSKFHALMTPMPMQALSCTWSEKREVCQFVTGDCDLEKWQTKEKSTVNSLVFEKASEWIFSIFYKLNHMTPMKLRPNKEKFSVELFQNLPHRTDSQKLTL